MHTNNTVVMVILALSLFSNAAQSAPMTVAEFEQKQIDIMNSDVDNQQKINQIRQLSDLFDATQALKAKIEATKNDKKAQQQPRADEKIVQQQKAKTDAKLAVSNDLKNKLEQKILDEIFLIELGVIGTVGKAEIIAQNRKYPIELSKAIAEKRVYGNYRINSFTVDSVTVTHIKTNKHKVLLVEDSATITAQINFNRELFNKYAEKALMGQLEVEITNQAVSTMPTPQPLMY